MTDQQPEQPKKRGKPNDIVPLKEPLWEQQEGEATRWFNKFLVYKDLGEKRKLNDAYRKSMNKHRGGANGAWRYQCRRFSWVKRAVAFDNHLAKKITAEVTTHRERASVAQEMAIADISEMIARITSKGLKKEERDDLLREFGPTLLALVGRGGAGNFLLNGHKTLFGEKHDVQETLNVEFND